MTEVRFVVDGMLLGLGRWLRFLGCDVVCFEERRKSGLVRLATGEGRIILSKDTKFCAEHASLSVYIKGETVREQLREVARRFLKKAQPEFYLTRCSRCNEILQKVEKASVRGLVPDYVFEKHQAFRQCPVCHRLYWDGDHARNIRKVLDALWTEKP
ncbi:MAG TPA: Mut7-C RNAse domain-containing protein [bacterium]|nr:Mut7-C RNAse domain-containing protein [bacterium]HPP13372.1 Mut7-C RNAse domain-containing protein [bacterium]